MAGKNNYKAEENRPAKKSSGKRIGRIVLAVLLIAVIAVLFFKGIIYVDGNGGIHFDPRGNSANVEPGGNTVDPSNTVDPGNTVDPTPGGNTVDPSNTVDPTPGGNTVDPEPDDGPKYYTSADLKNLKNTEIFDKGAIEHIFIGTVNSSKKGSGYHYNMIKDAKGEIVESTRSKPDKNGIYTANVTVDGYPKDHYSSFYPDDWSPQQVVDAINEAYKDAMNTKKKSGSYYVGYSNGIRIEMYLDSKNRVVTAYPVKNGK